MTYEKFATWKPDAKWKLINRDTGAELSIGSWVAMSNGTQAQIFDLESPHKPEASGRVWWKRSEFDFGSYYANVFNAEYVMDAA